jgi:type II secretion system protein G
MEGQMTMRTLLNRRRERGFTLVEIMIVVLIIGILLAIAVPSFMNARERSRANACRANLRQIQAAKEQWAMANNQGPTATLRGMTLCRTFCSSNLFVRRAAPTPSAT